MLSNKRCVPCKTLKRRANQPSKGALNSFATDDTVIAGIVIIYTHDHMAADTIITFCWPKN